jgi:prolyl oligopeptidase
MKASAILTMILTSTLIAAEVPKTDVKPVKEVVHGVEIVDPYRWLEGSAAPELAGKPDKDLDARVSAWTDAQNAYTRSVLDNLPGRKQLEARLRELMQVDTVNAPEMRRNRYFFWKREGKQAQPVILVQEGVRGTPRLLLDPNKLDKDGLVAPAWSTASHDGELLAFGLYRAGDENSTLYVMNVESGEWLADEIPGKVSSVYWLPDASGFFYSRLADVKNPYSRQIKFHKLGTHERQDKLLFEQYKEGPLATTWGPYPYVDRAGRWMLISYWTGTDSNDLWAIDLDRWFRTGEFVKTDIMSGADATFSGQILGDTLYMQTSLDAPNGRIFAVNLNDPQRDKWVEVVPERKEALVGFSLSRGRIVADYLKNAATEIALFRLDGKPDGSLQLPGIGSAGVSTDEDRTEAFVTYESFNEPRSIYRIDLNEPKRELWARSAVPVDPSLVEVKQVFVTSKDKTRVPMFIVHKKGLKLDGNNPTYLYGYGGFSVGNAGVLGDAVSVVRGGRGVCVAEPSRGRRVRRGLASRRYARSEAERLR